jgi:hypothetical protein
LSKHLPLAANPQVQAFFVYHKKIVALLAQDAIERIPDAAVGLETRHIQIAGLLTRHIQEFSDGQRLPARVRPDHFGQE